MVTKVPILMRTWSSTGGNRRETSWWVALWLLLRCLLARWILAGESRSIRPLGRTLIVVCGLVGLSSLSSALLFGLLFGWLSFKKSAEVQRVWDVYDRSL